MLPVPPEQVVPLVRTSKRAGRRRSGLRLDREPYHDLVLEALFDNIEAAVDSSLLRIKQQGRGGAGHAGPSASSLYLRLGKIPSSQIE